MVESFKLRFDQITKAEFYFSFKLMIEHKHSMKRSVKPLVMLIVKIDNNNDETFLRAIIALNNGMTRQLIMLKSGVLLTHQNY